MIYTKYQKRKAVRQLLLQNKRFGSIGNLCSLIKTVFVRQKWLSRLLHTNWLSAERGPLVPQRSSGKVPGNCAIHTVLDNQESSKRAFHVREFKLTCVCDGGHLKWPQTTSLWKPRWWSGAARGRNFRKLIGSFTPPHPPICRQPDLKTSSGTNTNPLRSPGSYSPRWKVPVNDGGKAASKNTSLSPDLGKASLSPNGAFLHLHIRSAAFPTFHWRHAEQSFPAVTPVLPSIVKRRLSVDSTYKSALLRVLQ